MTPRPRITAEDAGRLGKEIFGLQGDAVELPSTADRNFRIGTAVLKVVTLENEDPAPILQENELLSFLLARGARDPKVPSLPPLLESLEGRSFEVVRDTSKTACAVRALGWLDGTQLARVAHGPQLIANLGTALGALDRHLEEFRRPGVRRASDWDLLRATQGINRHLGAVQEVERCRLVERLTERFVSRYEPACDGLRRSVIHGDANDDNVLVAAAEHPDERFRPSRIAGLVDLGDAVETATICEAAIALTYLLLDGPAHQRGDPLPILAAFLRAYHRELPLGENELHVLFPLILQRMCFSVVQSAHAAQLEPNNRYRQVSSAPAWEALERLQHLHPDRVQWTARHACGFEAVADGRRLTSWLAHRKKAPVLGKALTRANTKLVDFSLTHAEFAQLGDPSHEPTVTAWTSRLLGVDLTKAARRTARGAPVLPKLVGWGRWDEPRLVYAGAQFGADPFVRAASRHAATAEEQRSVHLGVDLFVAPQSSVFAPLDGVVWSVADNREAFDYGGTVILEHVVALEGLGTEADGASRREADRPAPAGRQDGTVPIARFFTLYGHLDPASLNELQVGEQLLAGAPIGRLGDPSHNGGWTPHLHFQLILDLLQDGEDEDLSARSGNFPGVAPAAERELWLEVNPDPSVLLLAPPDLRATKAKRRSQRPVFSPAVLEPAPISARRRQHLSPNLSLSYRSPLLIVRGRGAELYDHLGRRYIDLVNNVCHVGHANPHVLAALHRQASLLNTNTRYLHPEIGDYAERLLTRLPEQLEVCFFVNSGSEANDLALRLARNFTARNLVFCLEGAYHGHTAALIDVSPYKHDARGGHGTPEHVRKLALPDPYRGIHRGASSGALYAADARRALEEARALGGPAALIVESILGCGGQIVLPEGYLQDTFAAVREEGGVCIADEVQVGFGRVGSHFWAFELSGVVPDIVTVGKPIGNGHPLAAVFTTRQIAAAFHNGMEYFNTFGGNPVSCAVGNAVLDVLEEENLQRHAWELGRAFRSQLEELAERHDNLGDVRGVGLFLGVELVRDRTSREPDAALAAYLVERMRERGYLLSTDGPQHNVIKIKPPLVLQQQHVEQTVAQLERVLHEIAL